MRATAIAACLLGAATLTACSSSHHNPTPTPSVSVTSAPTTTAPSPSPTASTAPTPTTTGAAGAQMPVLPFGKTGQTIGSMHPMQAAATPGAPLAITPTTVVYTTTGGPQNGMFAVVTFKMQAPMAAATFTAPATGGGWTWIGPDGQATSELAGNAPTVVLSTFKSDLAPAGAFAWSSTVFDVPASGRGGTLEYTDGSGTTWRWKMPASDTGPQVAQVKQELGQ